MPREIYFNVLWTTSQLLNCPLLARDVRAGINYAEKEPRERSQASLLLAQGSTLFKGKFCLRFSSKFMNLQICVEANTLVNMPRPRMEETNTGAKSNVPDFIPHRHSLRFRINRKGNRWLFSVDCHDNRLHKCTATTFPGPHRNVTFRFGRQGICTDVSSTVRLDIPHTCTDGV